MAHYYVYLCFYAFWHFSSFLGFPPRSWPGPQSAKTVAQVLEEFLLEMINNIRFENQFCAKIRLFYWGLNGRYRILSLFRAFDLFIGTYNMAIRVVEFSSGGYKLKSFLPKNQHKLGVKKNWLSKSIFYARQKSSESFSIFFSLKNTILGAHFL